MLNHTVRGPLSGGWFQVVYETPGCKAPTVVVQCTTAQSAQGEAVRLNELQARKQRALDEERRLCGLERVSRA